VSAGFIELRGVELNNLRHVDLDLPRRRLIVFCGVSGSGKSSMALDTLYAEGQRRYIESFSPYTRQFLEQLDKPQAERIEGIPPAVAVTHKNPSRSNRATIGTTTEVNDYLSLLFARVGEVLCYQCGRPVRRDSPEIAAEAVAALPAGLRAMIGFEVTAPTDEPMEAWVSHLSELGYVRAIVGGRVESIEPKLADRLSSGTQIAVVMDRLKTGEFSAERLQDSIEGAFEAGQGTAAVFVEEMDGGAKPPFDKAQGRQAAAEIDGREWRRMVFSRSLRCNDCGINYPEPEPQLFNFNRPLGACPECEGFGNIVATDMDRVVPDPSKTIRQGAIAPWNSPSYEHELQELLALSKDYKLPVDVPYAELTAEQRKLIVEGVPERNFGGLNGFFRWLERRKYKMHLRVFLSRWRSYLPCPACGGARLRPEALAVHVSGKNFADVSRMKIRDALKFFEQLQGEGKAPAARDTAKGSAGASPSRAAGLADWQQKIARPVVEDVTARLQYLADVGVGYLALDRPLRTLSGGEAQRVALTAALGSSLVDMLYVLDEPSVGLHPADIAPLAGSIARLHQRGNTVVVVEHEEAIIRGAEHVVEFGPGAGDDGGRVVFQGTPAELEASPDSRTGDWLAGRRTLNTSSKRRTPQGWLKLRGARGNNLRDVTVEFPLGVLCLVTGVSGAGKSTLVNHTLYPAVARCLQKESDTAELPPPLEYGDVLGTGQLESVVHIDQSPIGRSPRSNPVTYIKAFDPIRTLFAEQADARMRGLSASHFSFNVEGGRCDTCSGDGYLAIDMQFMADVYMKCPECGGRRYRRQVLEVKCRGLDIAEVLDLTAREAFTFFRGQRKVQARLKFLLDVGLDYLRLGQPATTLSGGEAQRLKLAAHLAAKRKGRTLFLLDEPTTGLHFSDVVQLVDCFDALLDIGHSLVIVEHNLQLMKAADWVIDVGPGAAEEGGRIVATGTPEDVAAEKESVTGRTLKAAFKRDAALVKEA
jgi:excinuclease ABC subunit A